MAEEGSIGREPGWRRDPAAYGYLLLMVLIISSTALSAKLAVRELPIALLPLARFGLAGLCLLPLAVRGGAFQRMWKQDRTRLIASAALCVPINQLFFLQGAKLAPTTHIGLFYATCPLVVLIWACLVGQERPRSGRLVGILASVFGVLLIGLENLWVPGSASQTGAGLLGDLFLIGAVVTWGGYMTVTKPLAARHGALTALAGTFLLGCLLEVPVALVTLPETNPWLMGSTWATLAKASPAAWWGLAHLTLVVSVVGLACQNQALRRLDASEVATFGNLAPILTVLWGALFLGEAMTPMLLVGGVLVLAGIARAARSERVDAPLVEDVARRNQEPVVVPTTR